MSVITVVKLAMALEQITVSPVKNIQIENIMMLRKLVAHVVEAQALIQLKEQLLVSKRKNQLLENVILLAKLVMEEIQMIV